ncbi:MAG: hypothetical protein AAB091_02895 [Elusimicrobiota bacterium]
MVKIGIVNPQAKLDVSGAIRSPDNQFRIEHPLNSDIQKHPFELVKDKTVEQIKQSDWDKLSPDKRQEKSWFARIEVVPDQ